MDDLLVAVHGNRPKGFDPRYYDREVKSTAEFRCSMHQEEYAFYAANNFLAGNVGFQGILSRKVKAKESLHGAAVMVLRVMEINHPHIGHDQRIENLARFIRECVQKKSKRLSGAVAGITANLFTFLDYRDDHAGLEALTRALISDTETPLGKRTLQMIIAPSDPLPHADTRLLYQKLKAAIESDASLPAWLHDKIGDRLMHRAYLATGFMEIISLAPRRERGKILEAELGF